MKIAFVSQLNSNDVHSWSGTPFYMLQAMKERGHDVVVIGPLKVPFAPVLNFVRKVYSKITGKFYDINRNPLVAESFSKQVASQIGNQKFDLIFSPSSIPCAYLKSGSPIVFWGDATFASMIGYYPRNFSRLSNMAIKHSNALEKRSIQNATLCLYTSEWAGTSAIADYSAPESKVKVICFGANLSNPPSADLVEAAINARQSEVCRFLFIGVDWKRKGGDLVVKTALALKAKGVNVAIDVVGCEPEGEVPEFVKRQGFISKSTEEGRQRMHELLLNSHYLFVPSTAECYGMVYAEASAYGLPSLARATGGVPTVVRNGINGIAFSSETDAPEIAAYVYKQYQDKNEYRELARSARRLYESTLNWGAAIAEVEAAVNSLSD